MQDSILGYLLVYSIASGVTCGYIASEKNRSVGAWLILGFLFGIFAMFAVAGIPKSDYTGSGEIAPKAPSMTSDAREKIKQVPLLSEEENAAALQQLIDQAKK